MGLVIAIDGYSCCGKSTLAKDLASRLNFIYIDSGAMYRAVTLHLMRKNVDLLNLNSIEIELQSLEIKFKRVDSKNCTFLNGENVENEIRSSEVSKLVSPISTISIIRKHLVEAQKQFAESGDIVMDGRDIGTVVFPDADLKLFMTADMNIRVHRRMAEFTESHTWTYETLKKNLEIRDHIDSTRTDSPLRKADDAIEIDTSYLSREEQLEKALKLLEIKIFDTIIQ
jgi:cytidylate kinase